MKLVLSVFLFFDFQPLTSFIQAQHSFVFLNKNLFLVSISSSPNL